MSYVALYRKFRPITFEEVIGQEHITTTLKNQVKNNRIGHAYLFSGGRGSGKTSTAKILARVVNCLNPKDGEPCNECEICTESIQGRLTDITEMDAASNNGVDNIRDIREEVEFLPTSAKYRVYIIDEVHMLSTGAFNALLKTLEEPPSHVIFILATTEPQKIPATILSRCQRFDFKRLSVESIIKGLQRICSSNSVNAEENALRLIANLAEGAMRDAISILDRCISDGETVITESRIRELTGVPEIEYLIKILKDLLEYNIPAVVEDVESIIKDGKDITVFIWELIRVIKDVLVYMVCGDINLYNEKEKGEFKEIINQTNKERLIDLINGLSSIEANMKWSSEKEMIFETGLIKLCIRDDEEKNQNIGQSDSSLKDKILTNLKENGKITMYSKLLDTEIEEVDNDLIHIIFVKELDDFSKKVIQNDENKMALKQATKEAMGKEISIKYVYTK